MPIVSLPEWQQFLNRNPQAHFLQTAEWGELKSAFGWSTVHLITGEAGCQILFRKLPMGYSLGYIPKPILKDPNLVTSERLWGELDSICTRERAIFCKLEPDSWNDASVPQGESSARFKVSLHPIQPLRTTIVDLKGSEESILSRMKQKTRYNIRLAQKKGVRVRAWDDLKGFHRMLLVTGDRDRFGAHSLAYYRRAYELFHPAGMGELFVAELEGLPLAALMVFARGRRAWYLYGASTDEKRNFMPTYLLQWEAMRWAKSRGCEQYDLWGVPDEEETALEAGFESRADGLWGVYRFKRGFGGEVKRASPPYDRVYNPILYWIYLRRMAGSETV